MDRIIFCLFLQKDIDIYLKLLPIYFPPMQDEETDAWSSEETREAPLADAPVPVAAVEDSPVEDKESKEKEDAAKDKKAEKEHSKDNTHSLPK